MKTRMSPKAVAKAAIFVVFLVGAIALFRYTPLREFLAPAKMQDLVSSAGAWGPLVFIALFAVGICLFLPATIFTGIGALLFGTLHGFFYNELGALLGASIAFFIGRYLGRDFSASLIGDRLQKYDEKIAENGFAATLYLRLIFFPFTPMNFGMGLTKVTFKDYFLGTFFGIIAGGFVLTFFFATVGAAWKSGNWWQLVNWESLFALSLFVASFFIPKLVKKLSPAE
jgi:uncharacterized membrane protein YdjX (TVP38/TMEM64 family)